MAAVVPETNIIAKKNDSVQFSCGSGGPALDLCLWSGKINGIRQMVVVDIESVQEGEQTSAGGIEYSSSKVDAGTCGLKISSVTAGNLGQWSCVLVVKSGQVFTGTVDVMEKG